jgi:Transposase domain (DUF772)
MAVRFVIPWNLSEWAEAREVLSWLEAEIGSLDWNNPMLADFLKSNPEYRPRLLLTLLSYAYALGVCESDEVVAFYHKDAALRRLFPAETPDAREISRFRRENRGLLKWCLLELFKRVLREKFQLGDTLIPAGLRRYLVDTATARLDAARDMDRGAHGAI